MHIRLRLLIFVVQYVRLYLSYSEWSGQLTGCFVGMCGGIECPWCSLLRRGVGFVPFLCTSLTTSEYLSSGRSHVIPRVCLLPFSVPVICSSVMNLETFGRILVCLFLSSSALADTLEDSIEWCDRVDLMVTSMHDKRENYSTTYLNPRFMLSLATLQGNRLTTIYPWVKVSEMEPERRLAVSQVSMLKNLMSRYPRNNNFIIEYMISDLAQSYVTIKVDDDVLAMIKPGAIDTEYAFGVDMKTPSFYAQNENLTAFLRSPCDALSRWRKACRDTLLQDTVEELDAEFVYYANTSTFLCSVRSRLPVDHYFYYNCVSPNMPAERFFAAGQRNEAGEFVTWTCDDCDVLSANCFVQSRREWTVALNLTIVGDLATNAASVPAVDTDVIVVLVVVLLFVSGLSLLVGYRCRSGARSRNDGRRQDGYVGGSSC